MARFNTALTSTSISGTATIGSPGAGAFTNLTGTAPYTVTVPNPTLFPGINQVFYNATSGTITLTTPSGNFNGTGGNGTASMSIFAGNVVSITSDGTHYIVISEDGSALTATTGAFSGNVTMNGSGATVSITPSTLTVTPSGASTIDNVAIGSTTRAAGAFTSLAANAAVTFTANTASTTTTTGTLVVTGGIGASGQVTASAISATNITGTLQTAAQPNITSTGALTAPSIVSSGSLTVDTTTLVVDATNDRVGIGTANPTTRLQVNNAADSRIIIFETGTTPYTATLELASQAIGTYGALLQYTSNAETLTLKAYGRTATSTTQGSILFNTKVANTTDTTVMTIHGFSGNVGINSSAPPSKLTVEGSGTANESVVRFNNQGDYASRIWLRQSSRSAYLSVSGSTGDTLATGSLPYGLLIGLSGNPSPVQFYNGTSGAVKMTIDTVGNVGIGATSPAYKLHVAGTSGTDDPRLTAVSATIAATAIDVFVYDTRKDSDRGAWRKRTQHTSWYNEPLNTATRGSRKEFPAVAVLVITSTALTIYDGDDPLMPMWMVFNSAGYTAFTETTLTGLGAFMYPIALTSVYALNGIIATTAQNYHLLLSNFIADTNVLQIAAFGSYTGGFGLYSLPISGRNSAGAYNQYSTQKILDSGVNDVTMTVLPGAPVDPYTRLPTPTIVVGTGKGASIVQNDGRVTNITCNNAGYTTTKKVTFLADNALGISLEAGDPTQEDSFYIFNQVPHHSTVVTVDARAGTPIAPDAFYSSQLVNTANVNLFVNGLDTARKINKVDRLVFGTDYGITQIDENRSNPSYGMTNFISSKYNTGWMVGNIRGAWLSDTTAETVTGAELITNGTFTSNVTGWTANTANGTGHTFSAVGGVMSVARAAGKGIGFGEPYQALTVEVNKQYVVSVDVGTTAMSLSIASALASGTIYYNANLPVGRSVISFTPTVTTVYLLFINDNAGTTSTVDNVSVRKAELDRSTNNKGLQIFGSIVKAPVATGADLVAYSGWSGSNYLNKPIDSTITGSTTRFFAGWMNCSNTSNYQYLMSIGNRSGGASWGVSLNVTSGNIYVYDNVNNSSFSTSGSIADGQWHFVCVADTGKYKQIYLDGKLIHTVTTATYTVPSDSSYYVGVYSGAQDLGLYPFLGSLALQRFGITIPSQTQIFKMYNDEKELFQAGAKACLYGSSDVITAITNDTTTNLVHVGTSAGRSVLKGIRRVDNTATAVSAAISASNSMIAEQ